MICRRFVHRCSDGHDPRKCAIAADAGAGLMNPRCIEATCGPSRQAIDRPFDGAKLERPQPMTRNHLLVAAGNGGAFNVCSAASRGHEADALVGALS
jgi:hypothetical protein